MLKTALTRLKQGQRTSGFPKEPVNLPERFRGRPLIDASKCQADCHACADACPTQAVSNNPLRIDLGQCLFCHNCQEVCTNRAVAFTGDYRLASISRDDLVLHGGEQTAARPLPTKLRRLFCRSFKLRQVSAGGCNGCEAELVALSNVVFDMGRFGIQFVASPRHADAVVVTGPVPTNMQLALQATCEAVPSPKVVVAVGACAVSGGAFAGSDALASGIPRDTPIDLFIPGCPPHPFTILDGLLRLLGRIEN